MVTALVIGPVGTLAGNAVAGNPTGTGSAEAQEAFRTTNTYIFSGFALFMLVLLTTAALNVLSIGRGEREALSGHVWVLSADRPSP
jgi:hypothetical protein